MEIAKASEFRSHLGKFLTAARSGSTVLLTSRFGNFRIVPITDEDDALERDLRESLAEVRAHMEGAAQLPRAKDVVF